MTKEEFTSRAETFADYLREGGKGVINSDKYLEFVDWLREDKDNPISRYLVKTLGEAKERQFSKTMLYFILKDAIETR